MSFKEGYHLNLDQSEEYGSFQRDLGCARRNTRGQLFKRRLAQTWISGKSRNKILSIRLRMLEFCSH